MLVTASALAALAATPTAGDPEERRAGRVGRKAPRPQPQAHAPAIDDAGLDLLAARARAGDKAATTELCAACAPPIRRYFSRALGGPEEAEEATQQVMVNMLGALPRYRGRGSHFRAFVFRIAHNHGLDRIAGRSRLQATDPGEVTRLREATEGYVAEPSQSEEREALDVLLAPLPTAQQQVIRLLYQHDLTPAQVGIVLGRSTDCVRQLHKRARDALQEIVMMQSNG
jgi:RNA polymerase sigma-70 factor, ECF subfamily